MLGRPPERTARIVRELRRRITHGDLEPGAQLPTRVEIGQHFGASSETVQRALEELTRDGFVVARGRLGTFVTANPPHLTHYALVISEQPGRWNRFFAALCQEAQGVARLAGREVSFYYGLDTVGSADFRRLQRDVLAHRIGGVIFTSVPASLLGTPMLDEPRMPRVAILGPGGSLDIPRVTTNVESFWDRAATELLARDRKDVALLLPPLGTVAIGELTAKLVALGLHVPRRWVHFLPRNHSGAATNLVELLFEAGRQRPNALVIADDNLVEHALMGLVAAGARVPADVEVVAHCNFPHPVPSVLAVHRLGFDVRWVLGACFQALDGLRQGTAVAPETVIQAQFETEIAAVTTADA